MSQDATAAICSPSSCCASARRPLKAATAPTTRVLDARNWNDIAPAFGERQLAQARLQHDVPRGFVGSRERLGVILHWRSLPREAMILVDTHHRGDSAHPVRQEMRPDQRSVATPAMSEIEAATSSAACSTASRIMAMALSAAAMASTRIVSFAVRPASSCSRRTPLRADVGRRGLRTSHRLVDRGRRGRLVGEPDVAPPMLNEPINVNEALAI